MRLVFYALLWVFLGFHVEPLESLSKALQKKTTPKPDFLVHKSEIFNLELRYPVSWMIEDSGREGFMIVPRVNLRKIRNDPDVLPYVDVYRSRDKCIQTPHGFEAVKDAYGKEVLFHEKVTCKANNLFVILTYWEMDPQKEKSKEILESILLSIKPLK